jgi:hypothetical protein
MFLKVNFDIFETISRSWWLILKQNSKIDPFKFATFSSNRYSSLVLEVKLCNTLIAIPLLFKPATLHIFFSIRDSKWWIEKYHYL